MLNGLLLNYFWKKNWEKEKKLQFFYKNNIKILLK